MLAVTTFGGPQAHISFFIRRLVVKRAYLTEAELLELYALCQILPGPTSTQTITSVGFRLGGPVLAYLTLLVWILPAVCLMTIAAVLIAYFKSLGISLEFTMFIQPMAVGFIAYAAYVISSKVVNTNMGIFIMLIATIIAFAIRSPFVYPAIIIGAGMLTSLNYRKHEREMKGDVDVRWISLILWAGIFLLVAGLGIITQLKPIRLFENFYRNGTLIFGGGQVLIPLLHTEFVTFKKYLTSEEFLSGFGIVQTVPGPTFSFSAYIGALSMREYGIGGQILGAFCASIGIFLPGTFFIFFVTRIWEHIKKYRMVKASLEGIHAASSGMVIAAALILFEPMYDKVINGVVVLVTIALLVWNKIPYPVIIVMGLMAGLAVVGLQGAI